MRACLTLMWLAAFLWAGGGLANPSGPEIVHGTAGVAAAGKVLTVTNSPGAIINWRSFSVAPDETTRFIQGGAGSSVLNRVIPGGAFSPLGQIESNGQVMFLNGSVVSGAVNADLAGLASTPLRLRDTWGISALLRPFARPPVQETLQKDAVATLFGERMFVLAAKKEVLLDECGELLVAPGRSVEIADLRWPNLRVQLTAPRHQALNLSKLIANENRMFSAVVANSSVTSQLSEESGTAFASAAPVRAPAAALAFLDLPLLPAPMFLHASLPETPLPLLTGASVELALSQQNPAADAPFPNLSEPEQLLAKDVAADQAVLISLADALKLPAVDRSPDANVDARIAAVQVNPPEPPAAEPRDAPAAEVQPPVQVALIEMLKPFVAEPLSAPVAEEQPPVQVALVEMLKPSVAEPSSAPVAEVQSPVQVALVEMLKPSVAEPPGAPAAEVQSPVQVALVEMLKPSAAEPPGAPAAEVQAPVQVALVEMLKPSVAEPPGAPAAEVRSPVQVALVEMLKPSVAELPGAPAAEVQPPVQVALAEIPVPPAAEPPSAPIAEAQSPIQLVLADLKRPIATAPAVATGTVAAPAVPATPVETASQRVAPGPVMLAVAAPTAPLVSVRETRPEPVARAAGLADESLVSAVAEMYADLPLTVREIWAAPKLARVERAMPRIMIDYSGAVFHL